MADPVRFHIFRLDLLVVKGIFRKNVINDMPLGHYTVKQPHIKINCKFQPTNLPLRKMAGETLMIPQFYH